MTESRDRGLGRSLRELDVPEHAPDFDATLRRRFHERPAARRRWLLAVAAVMALVVAAGLALVLPRSSGVASAAQVREAITDAFGSAGRLSGVFVDREQPGGGQNRWRFVISSSGSFAITSLRDGTRLVYDSQANAERGTPGPLDSIVGLAPGVPDAAPNAWVVRRGLGSVVAALAAAPATKVEEITYAGRKAWLLRTPTGNPGEELLITVDRETGVPVRSVQLEHGRFHSEWRIEDLRVAGTAPSENAFRPAQRTRGEGTVYDMGFRRVALGEAADAIGYRPLLPEWVPPGYERDTVAVARNARSTGDEQRRNLPSRGVVSLRYRRGLDQVVVTTRLVGPDRSAWGDPVTGSSVRAHEPERVTLTSGALRGMHGELVIDPNSVPHVWALTDRLVVTIAGDVDRDELLRIAESLRAF